MNKISVVIIEDEKPAARLLKSVVARIRPEWSVLLLPGSIEGATEWFAEHTHPDLILLDIQLADGNSFEFLEKARPTSTIIFTTAYDEYAIEAFRVNSIDYILKPVHEERLVEAFEKYEASFRRSATMQQAYLSNILESISTPATKRYRTRFLIIGVDKYTTLQVDEIAYFYSENKITTAVTHKGREQIIDLPLDKLTEQLDPNLFFRTNRQFIVGIHCIKKIEPYFNNKMSVSVVPPSRSVITVSREKMGAFKSWLNY